MKTASLSIDLGKAVDDNKNILIVAYGINEGVENRLKEILSLYLKKNNCGYLLAPLYTCVKELLMNAIKANFKFIFFEGYESKNEVDELIGYEKALQVFKLEMSREEARYLESLAKRNDIKAHVLFNYSDGSLNITVANPVPMTELEKEKVREKLQDAGRCEDISEYFLKIADDPYREGAGIGLVLVTMMLKSLRIPENGFSIKAGSSRTVAHLKIPLNNAILKNYTRS